MGQLTVIRRPIPHHNLKGELARMLNRHISVAIIWHIEIYPSECWANAVRALRTPSLHLQGAKYVEGFVVSRIARYRHVIEHGWLELEDGTIADPTIVGNGDEEIIRNCQYFPGVRYSLQELKGVRLRSLPRVWRTGGWGGFKNEAYKAAYVTANRQVHPDFQFA